ncbi:UDP-3-O-(3-hydroxymyristoyl)glucosamine N-acyltransferase [Microbaculum sp. FT89]|uniref:UDP-3-O-(3-hydroxymyristoyl)glucosamine N-acyltransferase n=1 Tax=Microbaculum sp. FT89 TaxID=3447298 RepID=UPI003F52CDD9
MDDVRFFERAGPFSLNEIAGWFDGQIEPGDGDRVVEDVATLQLAGPTQISFFDNPKYAVDLAATGAGACVVGPRGAGHVPASSAALIVAKPSVAFNEIVRRFYPDAARPARVWDDAPAGNGVHPTAIVDAGAVIEPGAIVGAEARIGRGTRVLAGSVIGRRVQIGRDCSIGPAATVLHALVGDRVIFHPGVRIGQDGFGFAMSAKGHAKIPQIGRVIIQDDVEVGANTTIDRGALRDTVIGEGTKIDNMVQIGHNVVIGRHCVIVSQVGIAGSATLGDFVAIGGQAGVMNHVTIGDGAQVATLSAVKEDLAPGGRYGGVPARPAREWLKEVAALQKLARDYIAERRPQEKAGGNGHEREHD